MSCRFLNQMVEKLESELLATCKSSCFEGLYWAQKKNHHRVYSPKTGLTKSHIKI